VRQLLDTASRVALHRTREVDAGLDSDHSETSRAVHQMHRLTRRAEAGFDLRAHRHPLDESSERICQKSVALVAAVIAHLLAEQARRDAYPNRVAAGHIPTVSSVNVASAWAGTRDRLVVVLHTL